ncbi:MAG: DNA cytosine methyltransferase [Chitinophagaceae bacterium]
MLSNTKTSEKQNPPPHVDIITGGFPCQDISVAGGFTGIIGQSSQLWFEYFRIICEVQPWYVVIENSDQLRNKGLEYILYDFSKIGYDVQWQRLSARQFGYPHNRKRLFIIAYSPEIRRRQIGSIQIFGKIADLLERPYRQAVLPMPFKRIKWDSNRDDVRMGNGPAYRMDRNRIASIGDAIVVDQCEYLFKCIQQHYKQLK